jgi:undecaprenyl-diphosphatase
MLFHMQGPSQPQPTPAWTFRLGAVDERALAWIACARPSWWIALMRGVSRTGDASSVIAMLVAWLLVGAGRIPLLVTVATLVGLVAFSAAKRMCGRARPQGFALLEAPDRFSLPSGHATCSWAIAVTLSALVPAAAPFVLPWALAVSLSRVVLGVHYPLDVVAGAALGALAATTTLAAAALA